MAARIFIILGLLFLVIGVLLLLFQRLGIQLGRLPGDFSIQRGNATCVVALGTSIFLSILLTILLNLIVRLFNR